MFKNRGLAFKLSLYILSVLAIIFFLVHIYNYQVSKRIILKKAEENAYNLTQSTVNKILNVLFAVQKIPENIAYILENSSFTTNELYDFMKIVVKNNDEIFGSCIAYKPASIEDSVKGYAPYFFKSGDTVRFKDLSNEEYRYYNWDWYTKPQKSGSLWTEPYFDEGGGNIIMSTFSVPFYDKDDSKLFKGVVTADISLEWLETLMKDLKIYESGYAFLLSSKGTIITHPETEFILKESIFSLAEKYNKPELKEVGEEIIKGKTVFMPYESLIIKGKSWIYVASLPEINWSMGVIFPENELFADLQKLNKKLAIIGITGFIILFLLIVLISQRIANPIVKLAKITHQIGEGNFDVKLPELTSYAEITQLTNAFGLMQEQLKAYIQNLKETTAAKEKIESELKIAHDIQQGIIPKIFPPFPQRKDVDIYALLHPAREVGGDLYDFFFIDDDILVFAIGDVSGKGVPSSLFMAITMTLLRSKTKANYEVNHIVQSINNDLCRDNENAMFVTFFMGIINLKTGKLNYCNAGHNYPYILRRDKSIECLKTTHGTPLGLFADTSFQYSSTQIQKNESIILYTDGVTEAMNHNEQLFGEERLLETISKGCHEDTVRNITLKIKKEINEFVKNAVQSDDITMLVLSYL